MIHNFGKQRNDQRVEDRMPGIVLAVLDLPPLIEIIPVEGARKISVEIHHQPGKYYGEAKEKPEPAPLFLFSVRCAHGYNHSARSCRFARGCRSCRRTASASLLQPRAGKPVRAPLEAEIGRNRHQHGSQDLDLPVFCIHGNSFHHLRQQPEQENQITSHRHSQERKYDPRTLLLPLIPGPRSLNFPDYLPATHFRSASRSAQGRSLREIHWFC